MQRTGSIMERTVLIKNQLEEIKEQKDKHQKKSDRYKKLDECFELIIITTGSVSTSMIIISLTSLNPILGIIGGTLGAVSTLASVIKKSLNFSQKYESHKSTANSLSDLYRDTNITLGKNGLSTDDKAHMLLDISHRMSIISDNALPI